MEKSIGFHQSCISDLTKYCTPCKHILLCSESYFWASICLLNAQWCDLSIPSSQPHPYYFLLFQALPSLVFHQRKNKLLHQSLPLLSTAWDSPTPGNPTVCSSVISDTLNATWSVSHIEYHPHKTPLLPSLLPSRFIFSKNLPPSDTIYTYM